jgi:hypothetical protein
MKLRPSAKPSGLTRRSLFQAGGVAGAAALVGVRPWAAEPAAAATAHSDGTPAHLLRSSYLELGSYDFAVDGSARLTLSGITDLPAAPNVKELIASEDAFALTFTGPAGLESSPRSFYHPELGTFDLLVSPEDASGTAYGVIVNRSVGALRHQPKPPKPGDARPGANADTGNAPTPEQKARAARRRYVRRMRARRTAKGIACTVVLAPDVDAHSISVWLVRNGRTVAGASARKPGSRTVLRAPTKRRVRPGRYHLAVLALGKDGRQHSRTELITLR